jgi:4-alpha-glucanotransferase
MSQIYVSLVFHNHQPVGNFDFVFQDAFDHAYLPLTNALDRHPQVKVAMHFTGPLIDWLELNQPDYLQQVKAQVARGQLEILSGAYYEPILTMLDDDDKLGQIAKLNHTVQRLFDTTPTGAWLAERIWEPHLPRALNQAGIDYTLIDDSHFVAAGFGQDELFGYFVTEEQGYPLKLVPTQKRLRFMIPWTTVAETMHWLREQAEMGMPSGKPPMWAVMGDDGEKFGMWPNSYATVWEKGWIDAFFEALIVNSDWITMIHPGEYVNTYRANNLAYLPSTSYTEMGEWALPSPQSYVLRDLREGYEVQLEQLPDWDKNRREEIENVLHFLRGSFWRNFLVKYPEINHMQKRAMTISKLAHTLPPSEQRQKVLDAVWAAQCNCAYWHGVFGGVYLFHIRSANYTNIIRAESMLDDRVGVWAEISDFNADNHDEVIVGNGPLLMIVDPKDGGMVTELDYRPVFYNLVNIMSRHPEGYHMQIQEAAKTNMLMTPEDDPTQFEGEPIMAKERGLEQVIYVDWHRRGMFNDHFLGPETTLHNFEAVQYPEQGNFVDQRYAPSLHKTEDTVRTTLKRDGAVWLGQVHLPVRVEKTFTLHAGETNLQAHYTVTNIGDIQLETRLGVELAFGFDGGDNQHYCHLEVASEMLGLGGSHALENVEGFKAVTQIRQFAVEFSWSQPATFWSFPLAPITLSEGGFERVHQGAVTMPIWNLSLAPGASWEVDISLVFSPLN